MSHYISGRLFLRFSIPSRETSCPLWCRKRGSSCCALHRAKFDLTERKLRYRIDTPLTTEFEKDGVNLSSGESQKIAIARTLYRNHQLIIMDETSSALDLASEYRLNQELKRLAADKTVIFISHRLAAARDYSMQKGAVT